MDSAQIDAAMRSKAPVMCDGTRYDCIKEYISWYDENGKRRLSVGLLQGRHLYRKPADRVELLKEEV